MDDREETTCRLTSRRSQPPLALAVPLSRFTPRVGGGSAFYVRHQADADFLAMDLSGDFGGSEAAGEVMTGLIGLGLSW